MKHFPELKSDNLVYCKVSAIDIPGITSYLNARKNYNLTLSLPFPYLQTDIEEWIKNTDKKFKTDEQITFAVKTLNTEDFIGIIQLRLEKFNRAELCYEFIEKYRSRGFVSEAFQTVMKYGFNDLKLNKIFATHQPKNLRAGRTMLNNHMKKEGLLREHVQHEGVYKDLVIYSILQSEFFY